MERTREIERAYNRAYRYYVDREYTKAGRVLESIDLGVDVDMALGVESRVVEEVRQLAEAVTCAARKVELDEEGGTDNSGSVVDTEGEEEEEGEGEELREEKGDADTTDTGAPVSGIAARIAAMAGTKAGTNTGEDGKAGNTGNTGTSALASIGALGSAAATIGATIGATVLVSLFLLSRRGLKQNQKWKY